jgi:hypothetical protein
MSLVAMRARKFDLVVKNKRLAVGVGAYNIILQSRLALLGESSTAVTLTPPMSEADTKVARLSKANG